MTLESIQSAKKELCLSLTLGASNISLGLPDRLLENTALYRVHEV